MMGLSDGERISMIRSAVLIQYTRVTDRQTDGRTDRIGVAYTRYTIYVVARKKLQAARKWAVPRPMPANQRRMQSTTSQRR